MIRICCIVFQATSCTHSHGLVLKRLEDEVGNDPSVIHVHPGPVGVEDPGHADLDVGLLRVGVGQCLGHTLTLVVAGPGADGIDVAPVGLRLRVDLGVAVDLGGRGDQDAGANALGQACPKIKIYLFNLNNIFFPQEIKDLQLTSTLQTTRPTLA